MLAAVEEGKRARPPSRGPGFVRASYHSEAQLRLRAPVHMQ